MTETTTETKPAWIVLHDDHGITDGQMEFIRNAVVNDETIEFDEETGFFKKEVKITDENLLPVPCGLYGPAMGDDPISETRVFFLKRGGRRYTDRVINLPVRPVDYVQVIGAKDQNGNFTIYTIYGGPEAPQHPADPTCKDKKASAIWWGVHALVAEVPDGRQDS
jgi:hypothetical protein